MSDYHWIEQDSGIEGEETYFILNWGEYYAEVGMIGDREWDWAVWKGEPSPDGFTGPQIAGGVEAFEETAKEVVEDWLSGDRQMGSGRSISNEDFTDWIKGGSRKHASQMYRVFLAYPGTPRGTYDEEIEVTVPGDNLAEVRREAEAIIARDYDPTLQVKRIQRTTFSGGDVFISTSHKLWPKAAAKKTGVVDTILSDFNVDWGYQLDEEQEDSSPRDYFEMKPGNLVVVLVDPDTDEILDSMGGVEVNLMVSDHGNVIPDDAGEQYLYEVAREMAENWKASGGSVEGSRKTAAEGDTIQIDFETGIPGISPGPLTIGSVLVKDILGIPSGGKQKFLINGLAYLVYYDESQAYGDMGGPVEGDVTGDYEVVKNDSVIFRQHVSPHGTSGYGNASAKGYSAEKVGEAIGQDVMRWSANPRRGSRKTSAEILEYIDDEGGTTFRTPQGDWRLEYDSETAARRQEGIQSGEYEPWFPEFPGDEQRTQPHPYILRGPNGEEHSFSGQGDAAVGPYWDASEQAQRIVEQASRKTADVYNDPTPITDDPCPTCGGPTQVWSDNSEGITVNFACDNPGCPAGKGPWDTPRPTTASRKTAKIPDLMFNLGGPYATVNPAGYENMQLGWDLFSGDVEIISFGNPGRTIASDVKDKNQFRNVAEKFFAQVFVDEETTARKRKTAVICPNCGIREVENSNPEWGEYQVCDTCNAEAMAKYKDYDPDKAMSNFLDDARQRGEVLDIPDAWLDRNATRKRKTAEWENGSCPNCGYSELNADSEVDEDGSFDVSCPNCDWRGSESIDERGHSDTYREDEEVDPLQDLGDYYTQTPFEGSKKAAFQTALQRAVHLALDPQSGYGDSNVPTVEEETPDDDPMWPWELPDPEGVEEEKDYVPPETMHGRTWGSRRQADFAMRLDSLESNQKVGLIFHGGSLNGGPYVESAFFLGITGTGEERVAKFRSVDLNTHSQYEWEAYRYGGTWSYGSGANRLQIIPFEEIPAYVDRYQAGDIIASKTGGLSVWANNGAESWSLSADETWRADHPFPRNSTSEVECLTCGNVWYGTTQIECPNCFGTNLQWKDRPTASRHQAAEEAEATCAYCGKAIYKDDTWPSAFLWYHSDNKSAMCPDGYGMAQPREAAKTAVTLDPDREPDDNTPAFEWEMGEIDENLAQGAADVAAVPTPGDNLEGYYPQPDASAAEREEEIAGIAPIHETIPEDEEVDGPECSNCGASSFSGGTCNNCGYREASRKTGVSLRLERAAPGGYINKDDPPTWLAVVWTVNEISPGVFGAPLESKEWWAGGTVEEYPDARIIFRTDGTVNIVSKTPLGDQAISQAAEQLGLFVNQTIEPTNETLASKQAQWAIVIDPDIGEIASVPGGFTTQEEAEEYLENWDFGPAAYVETLEEAEHLNRERGHAFIDLYANRKRAINESEPTQFEEGWNEGWLWASEGMELEAFRYSSSSPDFSQGVLEGYRHFHSGGAQDPTDWVTDPGSHSYDANLHRVGEWYDEVGDDDSDDKKDEEEESDDEDSGEESDESAEEDEGDDEGDEEGDEEDSEEDDDADSEESAPEGEKDESDDESEDTSITSDGGDEEEDEDDEDDEDEQKEALRRFRATVRANGRMR